MNRRSNSLSISLVIHALVLIFALFLYNVVTPPKKETKIPINLCQYTIESSCTCNTKEEAEVQKNSQTVKKEKEPLYKQNSVKQESVSKVEKKELMPQNTPHSNVTKEIITQQNSVVPSQSTILVSSQQEKLQISSTAVQENKNTLPSEHKTQTVKLSVQKQYFQTNLSAILAMLQENFYYPLSARKRNIQGEVVVKFTLLKNSSVKDIVIIKSSQEILDNAAIKTIENLNGKLPAPMEEIVLELPINYRLH